MNTERKKRLEYYGRILKSWLIQINWQFRTRPWATLGYSVFNTLLFIGLATFIAFWVRLICILTPSVLDLFIHFFRIAWLGRW